MNELLTQNNKIYVLPYIDSITFLYSERLGNNQADNLLTYFAGPLKISICGWTETITISTTTNWLHLLQKIIPTIKQAWNLTEEQITINNNNISIKLTYQTILLYIEHIIIIV